MSADRAVDYYELLQISPGAEPETIHRVYRLLAQRCHPDNTETGDADRFRILSEAYRILSDPELRAKYDVAHGQQRQDRWRLVSAVNSVENDFESEQRVRLTVLELLYTQRRLDPGSAGLSPLEIEQLIGRAREQLEFTVWYLTQKRYVTRSDSSVLVITAEGVEYLEDNYREVTIRRLPAAKESEAEAEAVA
jgi:curved DNA-binding protein CbpA